MKYIYESVFIVIFAGIIAHSIYNGYIVYSQLNACEQNGLHCEMRAIPVLELK